MLAIILRFLAALLAAYGGWNWLRNDNQGSSVDVTGNEQGGSNDATPPADLQPSVVIEMENQNFEDAVKEFDVDDENQQGQEQGKT